MLDSYVLCTLNTLLKEFTSGNHFFSKIPELIRDLMERYSNLVNRPNEDQFIQAEQLRRNSVELKFLEE
ncbi:hypothetical protein Glove_251g42 [Diversispora epigaea]|uniref:Uncharacterized protein n=1 Tax=Diversispora epigaea TaxID=1348612 RepID=A0A397IFM9_9GLOM|nr:hypothetical protein Glove_251g42 [Diversispora epigaea]